MRCSVSMRELALVAFTRDQASRTSHTFTPPSSTKTKPSTRLAEVGSIYLFRICGQGAKWLHNEKTQRYEDLFPVVRQARRHAVRGFRHLEYFKDCACLPEQRDKTKHQGVRLMKHLFASIAALTLMGSGLVPALKADEWDK